MKIKPTKIKYSRRFLSGRLKDLRTAKIARTRDGFQNVDHMIWLLKDIVEALDVQVKILARQIKKENLN